MQVCGACLPFCLLLPLLLPPVQPSDLGCTLLRLYHFCRQMPILTSFFLLSYHSPPCIILHRYLHCMMYLKTELPELCRVTYKMLRYIVCHNMERDLDLCYLDSDRVPIDGMPPSYAYAPPYPCPERWR